MPPILPVLTVEQVELVPHELTEHLGRFEAIPRKLLRGTFTPRKLGVGLMSPTNLYTFFSAGTVRLAPQAGRGPIGWDQV